MDKAIKGIIFDMDNTLLQSHIDFKAMKTDIYEFLFSRGLIPGMNLEENTTSTILETAKKTLPADDAIWNALWDIAKKYEVKGMEGVLLEPHVFEVLHELHHRFYCVVLTNNAYEAAIKALDENKIMCFFQKIVCREQVKNLKPAPDGVKLILNSFPDTTPSNWISVGDSWIDGKAAQEAGVSFISYRANRDRLYQKCVLPDYSLESMAELLQYLKN